LEKGELQNLTLAPDSSDFMNKEFKFNFIQNSKKVITAIGVFILICIISLFTLKLNTGIDFTGGRNYVIRFEKPVKTNEIRDALAPYFGESVRVITIGSSNQVRVSTNFRIDDDSENVEQELRALLEEGLKDYIASGKNHRRLYPKLTKSGAKHCRRHAAKNISGIGHCPCLHGTVYPRQV